MVSSGLGMYLSSRILALPDICKALGLISSNTCTYKRNKLLNINSNSDFLLIWRKGMMVGGNRVSLCSPGWSKTYWISSACLSLLSASIKGAPLSLALLLLFWRKDPTIVQDNLEFTNSQIGLELHGNPPASAFQEYITSISHYIQLNQSL